MSRKIISGLLALCLLTVIGYSVARLWQIDTETAEESALHEQALQYKPAQDQSAEDPDPLAQLREQNPDIVGWITVPGTNIDYPFVQAKDNDQYLRRDLSGAYATAGTVFMDYRSPADGAGYSILYGHNMKNGTMFGTLKRFGEKEFFDAHPTGSILLRDGWHTLQFFACLIVGADDRIVYGQPMAPDFLANVSARATHYREGVSAGPADRIIALSTCAYVFQGARMVLIGKIV